MSEHTEHKQPQPQRSESCIVTGASSRICERGTKSCEVKHDAASSEPQRPTIAELEAVLDEKVERRIEINPDGSLRVTRPSSKPPQEWTEGDDGWIHAGNHSWQMINVEDAQEAVAAHNAALAAERNVAASTQIELDGADKVIANLKQELAAEREKFLQMDEAHVTAEKELAALLKPMVDALEALKKDIQRGINHASLLRTINKALAQAKEQK